ncbi:exosortase/archaeosortase family protein [Verrucomicrobiaceae bacterium R5-34]|nr:exosortase/archaeosortase family protein [Verrucomicrobiaceae bacterium R5-34]
MDSQTNTQLKAQQPANPWTVWLPLAAMALLTIVFYALVPAFPTYGKPSVAGWLTGAWNAETEFEHGWAVPVLFVIFMGMAWRQMSLEKVRPSNLGLAVVLFGLLVYIASVRTIQPRLAMFALPFLIFGAFHFLYGLRVSKHVLFPAFFWYFAVPMPGLQQATNILQLIVTKACYEVGTLLGMKLVHSGNTITSAVDGWNSLDIAEGCSGIRSLIALMMIAAIYSYFTQNKIWKGVFLFACALPLAVLANFFRIFTIIVLAEFGFSDFAAGVYHDWAGLLFFFPIALTGLMLIDRLINRRENRKKVVVRQIKA